MKQHDNGLPGDGGKDVFVRGAIYTGCLFETRLQGDEGLAFSLGSGDNGGESSCNKNWHIQTISA